MPLITTPKIDVRVTEQITTVQCDKCGRKSDPEDSRFPLSANCVPAGFHSWQVSGGYSSTYPPDLVSLQIVVCDSCLETWVKTFKFDPALTNHLHTDDPPEYVVVNSHERYWLVLGTLCKNKNPETTEWHLTPDENPPQGFWEHRMAETVTAESLPYSHALTDIDENLAGLVQIHAAVPKDTLVEILGLARMARMTGTADYYVLYRHLDIEAPCTQAISLSDWPTKFQFLNTRADAL